LSLRTVTVLVGVLSFSGASFVRLPLPNFLPDLGVPFFPGCCLELALPCCRLPVRWMMRVTFDQAPRFSSTRIFFSLLPFCVALALQGVPPFFSVFPFAFRRRPPTVSPAPELRPVHLRQFTVIMPSLRPCERLRPPPLLRNLTSRHVHISQ